jgi:hypothetical protein
MTEENRDELKKMKKRGKMGFQEAFILEIANEIFLISRLNCLSLNTKNGTPTGPLENRINLIMQTDP